MSIGTKDCGVGVGWGGAHSRGGGTESGGKGTSEHTS